MIIDFPDNFFWGAAISSYQVEGSNYNCDWWEWEKRTGKEPSGSACRHYELYQDDFNLARDLRHNSLRLSIEWSRVEPAEGKFSDREIEHYKDVILALRERHLEPVVTLHHFTNPLWFSASGGWLNKNAADIFGRYVEKIVEALCGQVKYWVTINEPMIYVHHGYIISIWPPQQRSLLKAMQVRDNFIDAHIKSYRIIHRIYENKGLSGASVSIAHSMSFFHPCQPTIRNRIASEFRNKQFNFQILDRLFKAKSLDFIGVNYYSHTLVETSNWGPKSMLLDTCGKGHLKLKKNSLGWDVYPQGIYHLLVELKKYNLPLWITENGTCTDDDSFRWDFIVEHLKNIHQAMQEGVNVIGYFYWSLLDNFEWDKGFGPRFGLIDVDYRTFKRTVRESAQKLAQVVRSLRLDTVDR